MFVPAFEEMGREAVPQGVDGDVLAQPGVCGRPGRRPCRTDFAVKGRSGTLPGEEPVVRPGRLPVLAENGEQSGREHHVAVLVPLALADADDHPTAIDVGDAARPRPRRREVRRRRRS